MTAAAKPHPAQPRSNAAQWLGIVGPPTIWLVTFEAKYALAGNVSGSRGHLALVVIGFVGLLLIAACAVVSWREWRIADVSPMDRFAGVVQRARFLGAVGMLLSAVFGLVLVAQMLAELFIAPGKT
jgi:hypothetical protein